MTDTFPMMILAYLKAPRLAMTRAALKRLSFRLRRRPPPSEQLSLVAMLRVPLLFGIHL